MALPQHVGPASTAAVVGVVVVPAVDAVVVGRFGPTRSGLAHRREGTGPDLFNLDSRSRSGVKTKNIYRRIRCRPIALSSPDPIRMGCRGSKDLLAGDRRYIPAVVGQRPMDSLTCPLGTPCAPTTSRRTHQTTGRSASGSSARWYWTTVRPRQPSGPTPTKARPEKSSSPYDKSRVTCRSWRSNGRIPRPTSPGWRPGRRGRPDRSASIWSGPRVCLTAACREAITGRRPKTEPSDVITGRAVGSWLIVETDCAGSSVRAPRCHRMRVRT